MANENAYAKRIAEIQLRYQHDPPKDVRFLLDCLRIAVMYIKADDCYCHAGECVKHGWLNRLNERAKREE